MKRSLALMACAALTALSSAASANTVATPPGYITLFGAGWFSPEIRVQLGSGPLTNPGNCSQTDGYMTDATVAGATLFNSMLMSAYLANRRVHLYINGCSVNRPRIVGLQILPN